MAKNKYPGQDSKKKSATKRGTVKSSSHPPPEESGIQQNGPVEASVMPVPPPSVIVVPQEQKPAESESDNSKTTKKYDRTFLLELQYSKQSVQKPHGLPEVNDVVLDKMKVSENKSSHQSDFSPGFFVQMHNSRGRHSNEKIPKTVKGRIVISIPTTDAKPLNRAKDAWKPHSVKSVGASDDETVTGDMLRKFRALLNKLTPEKYDVISEKIKSLPMNTPERLKGIIDIVFEKAIIEPGFSVAYAKLCKELILVSVEDAESKPVRFRNLLINACQKEFERDATKQSEKREDLVQAIADAATPEKVKECREILAEYDYKEKRRSLGNIRFIGELYKLQLLRENIMQSCITKLLQTGDEESLEGLCKLLEGIGSNLDAGGGKDKMDGYCSEINKIIRERRSTPRVRFLLQDVVEMRRNSWKKRREDNNPKTLDEIHREAEREDQQRELMLLSNANSRGNSRDGKKGRGHAAPDDGWKRAYRPIRDLDETRLPTRNKSMDEKTYTLGPGTRNVNWGKGSSGGSNKVSSQENRPGTPNRYAALSNVDDSRSQARSVSGSENSRSGQKGSNGRSSQLYTDDRKSALSAARDLHRSNSSMSPARSPVSSTNQSRESSRSRDSQPSTPVPSITPQRELSLPRLAEVHSSELSSDEVDKKSIALLQEFLGINDEVEVVQCLKDLNSPSQYHQVVFSCTNYVLEKDSASRVKVGRLFLLLLKKEIFSPNAFIKGLTKVFEFAEDWEIDIPRVWYYLAEVMGQVMMDGIINFNQLLPAMQPLLDSNKAAKLIACIIHSAVSSSDEATVANIWSKGPIELSNLNLSDAEIPEFIKNNNLEFLKWDFTGNADDPDAPSLECLDKYLNVLLTEQGDDNNKVIGWIESNLTEEQRKSNKFIRSLVTAIGQSSVQGLRTRSVNIDLLRDKYRHTLLLKYLENEDERELQALFALQSLMVKLQHPSGMLRKFFDYLYDEDVINEESFYSWMKCDDPAEQNGKGAAVQTVKSFFEWLEEDPTEVQGERAMETAAS